MMYVHEHCESFEASGQHQIKMFTATSSHPCKISFFQIVGLTILPKATQSFPSTLGRNVPNFSQKYGCSLQRNRLLKLIRWQPTLEKSQKLGHDLLFSYLTKLHRNLRHCIVACASLWQRKIQSLLLPDWCDSLSSLQAISGVSLKYKYGSWLGEIWGSAPLGQSFSLYSVK